MPGGGFCVVPDELDTWSGQVKDVGSQVKTGADASGEVGVGGLIYGVLFDQMLLPGLNLCQEMFTTAATSAGELGEAMGEGLTHNAKCYREIDNHNVNAFNKADTQVSNMPTGEMP